MRGRGPTRWLAAVAAAVALVLAAAAPAAASPRTDFRLSLRNADGYRIGVSGSGRTVALTVTRADRRARTSYIAHGTVTANAIRARFPGFGRVAVRFAPSGALRGEPPCSTILRGRPGVFHGEIEFRGEGGYTSVRAHRAKGRALRLPKPAEIPQALRCIRRAIRSGSFAGFFFRHRAPRPKTTRLVADWKHPLGASIFEAVRVGKRKTRFIAVEDHTHGQLAILHIATAPASPLTFASDSALSFASVSPPAPFSGSGDLRRNPDGTKSWTGSLAVSFPGAPAVPLTGPGFKTLLARSWGPLPSFPPRGGGAAQ